jgi:hypothetical protein
MKRVFLFLCMLWLSGCAHLEIPAGNTYPFRAEFQGSGMINGMELNVSGALYLSSMRTGTIEVYGPGGLAAYVMDVQGDTLVLKDMWGNKLDEISLPLSDMAGMIAGDVPRGAYLYREKTPEGMKVTYHWGGLQVDGKTLPREVHINSDPPVEARFNPAGKEVNVRVNHGRDSIIIQLLVRQGGRWLSS